MLASFVNWLAYNTLTQLERLRNLAAITPLNKYLNSLMMLTPAAQIELSRKLGISGFEWDAMLGEPSPVVYTTMSGQRISYEFIAEYLEMGGDEYLHPVREFGHGSTDQTQAQALTTWLTAHGWVTPAEGNRPARWTQKPTGKGTTVSRRDDCLQYFFGE